MCENVVGKIGKPPAVAEGRQDRQDGQDGDRIDKMKTGLAGWIGWEEAGVFFVGATAGVMRLWMEIGVLHTCFA
jgi:hypothetical protein